MLAERNHHPTDLHALVRGLARLVLKCEQLPILAFAKVGTWQENYRNCPGTPAKRGLQAALSRKNVSDARKVAHSPPYREVPGHARGGTWARTKLLCQRRQTYAMMRSMAQDRSDRGMMAGNRRMQLTIRGTAALLLLLVIPAAPGQSRLWRPSRSVLRRSPVAPLWNGNVPWLPDPAVQRNRSGADRRDHHSGLRSVWAERETGRSAVPVRHPHGTGRRRNCPGSRPGD